MHYLIVDLSYYNFYRFFATKQWNKSAFPDETIEDGYDWSQNTIFWDKFKKMFIENLNKFKKKLKIDKIIFARDCRRENIWRMKFLPTYKENRVESNAKNPSIGAVFKRCYAEVLPELLNNDNIVIKIEHLEADDIIYLSVQELKTKYPDVIISVLSSDHDLLQIIDDNITLYNATMKSYNSKSFGDRDTDVLMKVVLGDTSDCIPKLFKGVGPKTALKLVKDHELLLKKINDTNAMDAFVLNKLLIDFRLIPDELISNFKDNIIL